MAQKEQQRTVYTTARGKQIDMIKLATQNELVPAVGNANVNARGDKLGSGGKIVKRREELQQSVSHSHLPKKNIKDIDPEGNE